VLHFLLHWAGLKRSAMARNISSRRHTYTKVLDVRKRPVRHLYRRNGSFFARISVEDEMGRKKKAWVPLTVKTVPQAQDELRRLLVEREDQTLRHIGESPTLEAYYTKTYLALLHSSGKKGATVVTERGHLQHWRKGLGHLRLDKIRPSHVQTVFNAMLKKLKPRTCNGALVALTSLLKAAKRDNYLKALPTSEIKRFKADDKKRELYTLKQIELVCAKGSEVSKNGVQLADYIRLLTFSGAREVEALKIRWEDVDFERKTMVIGWDGSSKNHEHRRVDISPQLEAHLRDMHQRRAPDSQWLFPSPQRGERDIHAKSLRESRVLARTAAKLPKFGFHDCRHFFVSHAVMSGVDYMTIAKWVGHRDGGVLIGKVYGHLSDEHATRQAAKISFT
jgi:integrase